MVAKLYAYTSFTEQRVKIYQKSVALAHTGFLISTVISRHRPNGIVWLRR